MYREEYSKSLEEKFHQYTIVVSINRSNPEIEVNHEHLIELAKKLKKDESYEILMDVIAVDFLTYGDVDWKTNDATNTGYSRAVKPTIIPEIDETFVERFAVFYQLLSVSNNRRLTLKVFASESNPPSVPSLVDIWSSADWFEREGHDLFGVDFEGHPDMKPLLLWEGFPGYPGRRSYKLPEYKEY